ncbi:RNA polymerase sigma-70 factor (ECF subfamily) [Dyadobacter sp. BE34]|jgi:RNA polymerase sigma factor (sigma-70 family)|uniref:RNA polymerase sigma-70 factor (ECF subfamily) n=1 Tax=Dyadobacter fermentans TaxID=94254 RepID=A0ABU1QPJ0_9BACT|nr:MULTISPECIES: sigma-70 family RNA polymerase sigma factor [Dyadobacter]MBZ1358418.1 sigma-70 family RNA polymerase sigma factor [Dyadobacter fermentans]MDR6803066.1 RNA polymerase sigma-70 factor (ECF subfamily) [Dyadobacter fermentans]MDR7040808.1 RNA polymerase sigma-70 factor (ECF subfamily) [Dyadobacter sp. BE242]MDR7195210.1 RNA polymerase sigma-70 factor (ECF subfamily) [Dyadobacter sp. BE34]MDR7214244.1 RNA polymerase sigma-70 factor (ECF subfamily) [Dyadobacter sp. BE31]
MPEYNSAVLQELLDGCLQKNRRSQELLYKQFYGYAMSICLRYTRSREEAKEILNDGFLKVFTKLESFDASRPFKTWLSRIMINTALDHYRQEVRRDVFDDVEVAEQVSVDETVISKLSHEELIGLIQRLTPAYRLVFSLSVIDGYTHEEIAEQLNISVGASKSNLSRAREKLRDMLSKINIDDYDRVAR